MTSNIEREISRNIPRDIPLRFIENETTIPLFTAYGCVLIERDTGKSYVYTAVNLESRKRKIICRRPTPLTTSGVEAMAEKIRLSSVAGAGRLEADRPFGKKLALKNCRETLTTVFKEILPQHGFIVRKEQISLANHILDAISRRQISLAEAEVGTGKTLAYLIPAIIAKRGRLNGYWNLSYYTGTPFVEMAHMPIVIATSSIALQKAIVKDYIPQLSDILLEHGVIKTPLTTAIRKGREHYVCEQRLRSHIPYEPNPDIKEILESLTKPFAQIDIAEIDGLNAYAKRRISVPDRCDKNCPYRSDCAYLSFREQVQSPDIDIQVCNHNYLLADTMRRAEEKRPLIPNYQMVIIDEAHKFLSAARSMYGVELSCISLLELENSAKLINFKNETSQKLIHETARLLTSEATRLFRRLEELAANEETDEEADRLIAVIDKENHRHIKNIHNMTGELIERLTNEPIKGNSTGRKAQLLWDLEQIYDQIAAFVKHNELICWIETGDSDCQLCAIPKNLNQKLYEDIWGKGIPTVLTSGTLSTSGAGTSCPNFSRIKKTFGMESVSGYRLTETSKQSPFNYRKNALIYISENMPFPDQRDNNYILAAANEIEQLIYASRGRAAVLFTSYKAMDMVWEHLVERDIPFPFFRLDKGGVREIDRFKESGNGVLFAAGALWEGIDIPGDALSMVIIAKLPFPVPDPISDYEKSQYENMNDFKEFVIIPETLIKTKQGSGRVIRTEKDTGVMAFLDCRISKSGAYRKRFLNALPNCHVTDNIDEVEQFYIDVKTPEYHM